jgi:hypothetical protein
MPSSDTFSRFRTLPVDPATSAAAVTPHNTNDLTYVTRALYVGTGGDVKVNMADSGTVTFVGVPTGTTLAVRASRVYSTGTTATDIVALW